MRFYFVLVVICVFLLSSCDSCKKSDRNKPTEFFLVDSAKSYTGVYQAFVVYNAPKDTLLLQRMIENYNLRTIPVSLLKQYKRYTRVFYNQSEFLTKDHKADAPDMNPHSPYTYQDLNNFLDDQIMSCRYEKRSDGGYQYIYYFNRNSNARESIIIHNLDSFYYAKWIETADIDTIMVK